jgi:hypothetical protein
MAPEPGEEGGRFSGKGPSLRQMATPAGRPLAQTDVLSTSEVAELLGIPRSTVHELARGGVRPRGGSDAASSSCATVSPRQSRRWTIRPPGGLEIALEIA